MHYALQHKREDVVLTLLSRNDLDLSIKNNEGRNAIDLALNYNMFKTYEVLVIEFTKREEIKEKERQENQKLQEQIELQKALNKIEVKAVEPSTCQQLNEESLQKSKRRRTSISPKSTTKEKKKYEISYSNKMNLFTSDTILTLPLPLFQSSQNQSNLVSRPLLQIDLSEEVRQSMKEKNKDINKNDNALENKALLDEIKRLKFEIKLKDEIYLKKEEESAFKLLVRRKRIT